jgi:DNA-binding LacI/PurR family transcriptional regulator
MAKTLKEVASKLNTSVSTISRVINNKANVNEETRRRVLEALEHCDYTPNQVARSLKVQSTKIIGIIVPDICERFFGQIIKGIDEITSSKGYSIILFDSGESKEKEEKYLDMLFRQRVDALVIATVDVNSTKVLQFIENNIPVVFIDNLPNIPTTYDAVLIDNVQASRLAIKRLLEKGHVRIAVIAGSLAQTTGYDRLLGYKLALQDAGIEVDDGIVMIGNYKEESGYRCMEQLISNKSSVPFTAVYVASEMMTYGAIKAMQNYGIKFPDDVALIGFDVHDKTGLITPGITTIRQPEHQIGQLTAEALLKKLKINNNSSGNDSTRNGSDGHRILLNAYMEERQSC